MANDFKIRKGLIVLGSGSSTPTDIYGSQGELFSITDSLSGSLFSVNDISGIPVIEAFSNNWVNLGTFNREGLKVRGDVVIATGSFSGSLVGSASFATTASFALNSGGGSGFPFTGSARLTGSLDVTGSVRISGSLNITGSVIATSFTGSLFGSASYTLVQQQIITSSFVTSSIYTIKNVTGSYTLQITDASSLLRVSSGSAANVTIPSSSLVPFITGSIITVEQSGTGIVTFITGSGVTILPTARSTYGQYTVMQALKVADDSWNIIGSSI